jgi:hypothetical protein
MIGSWVRLSLWALALTATPFLLLNGVLLFGRGPWAIPGSEFLVLLGFLSLPLALVGCAFLPFRGTRRGGTFVLAVAAGMFTGMLVGIRVGWKLRYTSFELAARRAEPLIDAIERFESATGHPPERLDQLVPTFLPALPVGIPPLEIVSGPQAEEQYHGNPWALRAGVGIGFLNWDQFMYLPKQNYPSEGHGGWLQRIGAWAYVHE